MKEIREARRQDAGQIAEIYRPYVVETPISFETEAPSSAEMLSRMEERTGKFPWLVLERGGKLLGYAYAGPFRSRCAYEWSVEASIYVRQGHHRAGVGKALYGELLEILRAQGAVNVIGGVTLPNAASVGLHEGFGFRQVACFKDVGFKLGQWWDVGYWQLQLDKPKIPGPLRAPSSGYAEAQLTSTK